VTHDQVRRTCAPARKTINFATIYGQGPFALSRQLGITQDDAKRFIEQYFTRFRVSGSGSIAPWPRRAKRGTSRHCFGRRRYIPELKDRNYNIRAFGERTATNSPLQGSAADLIKIAMIRIAAGLKQRGLASRMILQVP